MTKQQIVSILNLTPHIEGGFFGEVYRSKTIIAKSALPASLRAGAYCASTCIYYMLGALDCSSPHSLALDETWHFYAASDSGVFVKLAVVSPEGDGRIIPLGSDFANGQIPQFTIPAGFSMCAKLAHNSPTADILERNNSWALCGASVAPGFEYQDFIKDDAAQIAARCQSIADFVLSCK